MTPSFATLGLADLLRLAEHYDGYKREAAVRRLGELGDPAALTALLPRVNDWVPQVRAAALEAIRRLMVPVNAPLFVSSLPAVFHLARCGRDRHAPFIEEISEYLAGPVNAEAVRQGFAAPDPRVRRLCYDLAFDFQLAPQAQLVSQAIQDPDIIVQSKGAGRIASIDSAQIRDVLARALWSPTAGIRLAALQLYLRQPVDESTTSTVKHFALDSNSSVRSVAVDWLRRQGVDVAEVFLRALREEDASTRKVRAAMSHEITGIGSVPNFKAILFNAASQPLSGAPRPARCPRVSLRRTVIGEAHSLAGPGGEPCERRCSWLSPC